MGDTGFAKWWLMTPQRQATHRAHATSNRSFGSSFRSCFEKVNGNVLSSAYALTKSSHRPHYRPLVITRGLFITKSAPASAYQTNINRLTDQANQSMRMQNKSSTCGYGLSSQVGYLFERQRSAMRQNSFARARNVVAKRKSRDEDSDEDERQQLQFQQPPNKKLLLEGIKRMRVSSPTSVDSTTTSRASASADSNMTDFTMDGDYTEANAQALVPVAKQPRRLNAHGVPLTTKWSPAGTGYYSSCSSDLGTPPTDDASCTALVLFEPTNSIPRGPSPRIELVDSDEEQDERRARRSGSDDDDDDELFVRFEEIHDDDEPMEID